MKGKKEMKKGVQDEKEEIQGVRTRKWGVCRMEGRKRRRKRKKRTEKKEESKKTRALLLLLLVLFAG